MNDAGPTSDPPLPPRLRELAVTRWRRITERARDAGVDLPALGELPGDAARVLAVSEFVAEACRADPSLLAGLLESGALDSPRDPRPVLARLLEEAGSEPELAGALRRARRREWVRIAWRDLGGLADLAQTVAATSEFAERAIGAAVERLHAWQCETFGTPCDARDATEQRLCVLALGKLGARELNFSSDVDLMFTFPGPGETRGARRVLASEEFFVRLGRRLVNLLSERTADGFVFRVDMRLRPFGASGPLAMSAAAMEDYYQTHGRDWERYALIRARPIAGDVAAGEALLERLEPFVYRRYLDFATLESLRDMKRLIEAEVRRRGLEGNVKLGPGGIREVEFTGQAFQMVRGGRIRSLRSRSILAVLDELARLDLLPGPAVRDLKSAYRFLRETEHRLQQVNDRQTHELPADEEAREVLAAGMRFPGWPDFERALSSHRARVNAHFQQVFGVPEEAGTETPADPLLVLWSGSPDDELARSLLAEAGFPDPTTAWDRFQRFRLAYPVRLLDSAGRRRMGRLLPDLLRAVATRPDPVETLDRVLAIVETIARRSAYLALLAERPIALSQLVRLCAASPWIAREIRRHPVLLDELLDPRSLYAPAAPAALAADLEQRLANVTPGDTEQEMSALRQFKHSAVLKVAAADLFNAIPLMVVSDTLTAIAELTLRAVLRLAWRDVARRYGEPRHGAPGERRGARLAVIAYGKLGGLELGYGSDLDLVFVHDGEGPDQCTDGPRVVDNTVFFGRVVQRMIHFLTTLTPDGILYEVDARLRPSGTSGLIVNRLDALERYLREEAWTWEHQALVRARPVAGDEGLAEGFRALRRRILLAPRDPRRLREEVRAMRQRMREELGSGDRPGFDLKQDPGGMADIEFMVQYLVLRSAGSICESLDFTDNIRLLGALGRAGHLAGGDVELLIGAYRAYRARIHRQALREEPPRVPTGELDEWRRGVLRIWRELMEDGAREAAPGPGA